MTKRQTVNLWMFFILLIGTVIGVFGISGQNSLLLLAFPISFVLAMTIGMFKRQIYQHI